MRKPQWKNWMILGLILVGVNAKAANPSNISPSGAECGSDAILDKVRDPNPDGDASNPADSAASIQNFFIPSAMVASHTTAERVKDCSVLPQATKKSQSGVTWNLVARSHDSKSGKYYEVWQDSRTGLLLGDTLDSAYTHYNAVDLDNSGKVLAETACDSDEGKKANAQIAEKKFGLPTIEEYQQLESDGIREIVPNMNYLFWSASLYPINTDCAREFYGFNGYSDYGGFRGSPVAVRCIGR